MKTDANYREELRRAGVKGEYIDAFGGIDLDRIGNIIGVYRTSMAEQNPSAFAIAQEISARMTGDSDETAVQEVVKERLDRQAKEVLADAKIERIDASIAKQLQQSMERNARMVNRLKKLQFTFADPETETVQQIATILKDEEPVWPAE